MKKLNKEVALYLTLTLILSIVPNFFLIKSGTIYAGGKLIVFALMWVPAIAAFLTLLILKKPIKTILWKPGKFKYLAKAVYIPLIYISLAYIPLWLIGYYNTEKQITFLSIILMFAAAFANIIATAGEEIGWRGFLFPQLNKKMSFMKAAIITGLIWSVWHVPGLLFTDYSNHAPWYTAVPFFIITLTAISVLMAYLFKKSGSVWPAVLFHGAHNAYIQAFYDPYSLKNAIAQFLIGETGVALVVTSSLMLLMYLKTMNKSFGKES